MPCVPGQLEEKNPALTASIRNRSSPTCKTQIDTSQAMYERSTAGAAMSLRTRSLPQRGSLLAQGAHGVDAAGAAGGQPAGGQCHCGEHQGRHAHGEEVTGRNSVELRFDVARQAER